MELAIPNWAERRHSTSWHSHHIAERFGLFAIILFGESLFAASTGAERALASGGVSAELVAIGAAAPVLVFTLLCLCFLQQAGHGLVSIRRTTFEPTPPRSSA